MVRLGCSEVAADNNLLPCVIVRAYFFFTSLCPLNTCIRPVKQFRTHDARYELIARKFGLIMVCHDVSVSIFH